MGADRPDGGTARANLVARTRTALRPGRLGGRPPVVVRPSGPADRRRGVWIALGLFFFLTIGLAWSRYAEDSIGELRGALGWSNPTVSTLMTSAGNGGSAAGGEHSDTGSQARQAGAPTGRPHTTAAGRSPATATADARMDVLFGPVNQLTRAMLAVALTCLIVWGYVMWWQRRPNQDRRLSFGRPTHGGGSGTTAQA
jgi:uncharacterized iron-regulated membrane protein